SCTRRRLFFSCSPSPPRRWRSPFRSRWFFSKPHGGSGADGKRRLAPRRPVGRLLEASFYIRGVASNLFTQVHGIAYLLSRLVLPHALNIDPDLPVFSGWAPALLPEDLLLVT